MDVIDMPVEIVGVADWVLPKPPLPNRTFPVYRTSSVRRVVVHLLFEDDSIRLISARKATREERLFYENE